MLNGRTQEEIREVLLGWGKEVLEQIEEVIPIHYEVALNIASRI